LIVARVFCFWTVLAVFGASGLLSAQQRTETPKQQEPPEEDASLKPKEYEFNPLQAEQEMRVGGYYFRKGSYRAAANRFREATRWNPTLADAYFRLGQASEKLRDRKAARDAYARYLELAPDGKDAAVAKRRLSAP
jgi:tetratricopeptide (TPR) repeat protein